MHSDPAMPVSPSAPISHANPFPLEILEAFVDELGNSRKAYGSRGSHKALASCLLVSRAFRQRARRYIFAEIAIFGAFATGEFDDARVKRRISLLRNLTLDVKDTEGSILPLIQDVEITSRNGWTRNNIYPDNQDMIDILTAIDRKSTNFHSLKFDFHERLVWSSLSSEFRLIALHLIRSPRLTSLYMRAMDHLPSSLLSRVTASEIHLLGLTCDMSFILRWNEQHDEPDGGVAPENAFPPLQYLRTDTTRVHDLLYDVEKRRVFRCSLEKAVFYLDDVTIETSFQNAANILAGSESTLQELTFQFPGLCLVPSFIPRFLTSF